MTANIPDPRTARLREADRRYLWHPFTQMEGWMEEEFPIIERGQGCWLWDTGGAKYLDAISSLWCNLHGHRVLSIDRAVKEQLERLAHSTLLGLANVPSIQLAERLAAATPAAITRVFYSDAGATAVEAALKIAFQYMVQTGRPQRTRFAALGAAYHGDTIGSVSLGGIEVMHGVFDPLRFHVLRIPPPHCYRCPLGLERGACDMACADEADRLLEQHADTLAGFVIEPLVQGAAGILVHPDGYLRRIREACSRHGILLIADEVATGFGRTGTCWACEQEQVTPDLLCLAKGISGGYLPLAATMATETIFEAFLGAVDSGRTFYHGHTYTGNPLACAASLASLDLLQDVALPRLPLLSQRLGQLIQEHIIPLDHVGEVRRKGVMVGIELVRDRRHKTAYDPALRLGHQVVCAARKQGVIIRPLGDVIVLMPPLAMTDGQLQMMVETTARAIHQVTQ